MGQQEVSALLRKKGEMENGEIDRELKGVCTPKTIDRALRVMKEHNEVVAKVKGFRRITYKLI